MNQWIYISRLAELLASAWRNHSEWMNQCLSWKSCSSSGRNYFSKKVHFMCTRPLSVLFQPHSQAGLANVYPGATDYIKYVVPILRIWHGTHSLSLNSRHSVLQIKDEPSKRSETMALGCQAHHGEAGPAGWGGWRKYFKQLVEPIE